MVVGVLLNPCLNCGVKRRYSLFSREGGRLQETVPTLLLFPRSPSSPFLLLDLNSFLFCPQSTHNYILFWLMFSLQKSRRFRSQLMADKLSAQHQTLETFGSMCSKWSLLTEKGTGDHCSPSNDEQCPPVLKERPCSVSPQVSLEGVRSFLLIHYTVIMVFKLVFISYEFRDGTFVSINLISQHLTV